MNNLNSSGAKPEYIIGIHNDDGDCYDIVIMRRGRPIATLIAPEAELEELVLAGNCYASLSAALRAAEEAIEEATDLMHSHDDQDIVFASDDTEKAFRALTGVMVQVDKAIALCGDGEDVASKIAGGAHA